MKKTLVALAALAATGASFAQVTLTGNIGPSYQMSPELTYVTAAPVGSSTTRAQGLQIQDGEINVTATEDLGGGWKAIAKGGLTVRGRDTAPATRDATVTLITPMGAITAGAVRTCGPWESMMTGVVTGPIRSGNENNVYTPLPKCALIDVVSYSVPVGPVSASLAYGEFGGASGNATGLTFVAPTFVYTAGPLMAGIDATFFSQAATGTVAAGRPVLDGLVRTRLFGTYNFGIAKLGLGYQTLTNNIASTMTASLTVPMGPVVFGLEYAARDAQGEISTSAAVRAIGTAVFGATDGDKASSSVGLGATYSFSKSVTLNTSYIVYNDAGANTKVAGNAGLKKLEDEYRVRLMKTF
jgi:predicted porin